MPEVSVVIPTFGRPALLQRAVKSVLCQTMADFEIIVVIDGEDPQTVELLESVEDPRLRFVVRTTQKGAGFSRDRGAQESLGKWVAFLDDDDEWLPEKLEKQLASAPDHPAILMTLSHVATPEGTFVRPVEPYDGKRPIDEWIFDRTTWLKGGLNFLQTSSLMVPRSLFDNLQFRDNMHEEWELVIRSVKQYGYELVTVKEPLVIHYVGQPRPSLSKTQTWERSIQWASSISKLLTARAYSGFILMSVGQNAANRGEWSAFWPLVKLAFQRGKPTSKQIFRYVMCWIIPRDFRRKARARVQGDISAVSKI
jgi:GT2 family glycosyltransferase